MGAEEEGDGEGVEGEVRISGCAKEFGVCDFAIMRDVVLEDQIRIRRRKLDRVHFVGESHIKSIVPACTRVFHPAVFIPTPESPLRFEGLLQTLKWRSSVIDNPARWTGYEIREDVHSQSFPHVYNHKPRETSVTIMHVGNHEPRLQELAWKSQILIVERGGGQSLSIVRHGKFR